MRNVRKLASIVCKFTHCQFGRLKERVVHNNIEVNMKSVREVSGLMEEPFEKCWHTPDSILQFSLPLVLGWLAKKVSTCTSALKNFLLVLDHWLIDEHNRLWERDV